MKGIVWLELLPFYKEKLENNKILITNFSGGWLILSEEQFNEIITKPKKEIDPSLVFLLEEEGFLKPKDIFFKERYKHLALGTYLHIVSLTKDCNLQCDYCFMDATQGRNLKMDKKTAEKVVEFIFKSKSQKLEIHFTGGEPLLNFEVLKFITEKAKELAKRKNKEVIFSITTNLTILNKEIIKFFKENNFSVTVSIDGPKEVHEFNRGPNFDLVMENIKKLRENKIITNFLPVITKLSLKKWKKVVDFFVYELNYPLIHWKYMYPTGKAAKNWDKIGYTAEEFVESWKKVIDYLIELNERGINVKERIASTLLTKILKRKEANLTCLMNPCGAISLQISYDYDGSIYTCDEGKGIEELKLGDVFNDNPFSIRNKPLAKEMVLLSSNLNYSCRNCAFNPWCGTCVVENLAWQKNYYSHVPSSFRHKVLYEQFKYLFKLIDEKPEIMEKWTI